MLKIFIIIYIVVKICIIRKIILIIIIILIFEELIIISILLLLLSLISLKPNSFLNGFEKPLSCFWSLTLSRKGFANWFPWLLLLLKLLELELLELLIWLNLFLSKEGFILLVCCSSNLKSLKGFEKSLSFPSLKMPLSTLLSLKLVLFSLFEESFW